MALAIVVGLGGIQFRCSSMALPFSRSCREMWAQPRRVAFATPAIAEHLPRDVEVFATCDGHMQVVDQPVFQAIAPAVQRQLLAACPQASCTTVGHGNVAHLLNDVDLAHHVFHLRNRVQVASMRLTVAVSLHVMHMAQPVVGQARRGCRSSAASTPPQP